MNSYWLNIYKPKGISSAYAVGSVKRALDGAKIGHCGTLDVEAEGVLPLAINEATKLVQILVNARKTYIFTAQFGVQTDSADYSGKIINTTSHIPSEQDAKEICSKFIGTIEQTPPIFSAIKVKGQRSYKLARDGLMPKLASRKIEIYSIECINFDAANARATYEVECSKGTYIRTLAEDMALSLQSLAFVLELRRTRVGIFDASDAIIMPESGVFNKELIQEKVIKIEAVLDDILVLEADLEQAKKIKFGQDCYFNLGQDVSFVWIRYNGTLLAIGALSDNRFDSFRVFNLINI